MKASRQSLASVFFFVFEFVINTRLAVSLIWKPAVWPKKPTDWTHNTTTSNRILRTRLEFQASNQVSVWPVPIDMSTLTLQEYSLEKPLSEISRRGYNIHARMSTNSIFVNFSLLLYNQFVQTTQNEWCTIGKITYFNYISLWICL